MISLVQCGERKGDTRISGLARAGSPEQSNTTTPPPHANED